MWNVYFVQHGETVWNVENKICGATEGALTERRREQVRVIDRETKARMDTGELRIDRTLCSPPSRARDTAQKIVNVLKLPLAIEPRLREQDFGIWEGVARDGEGLQHAKENFTDSFGTGESILRFIQCIYSLLDDVRADVDHTYLLIAHSGISRMAESYFRDMDNGESTFFGVRNAAPHTYCYPEET